MTPAVYRSDVDTKFLGDISQRPSILQCGRLPQPLLPFVQPAQRSTAQSVERPSAFAATITLQAVGVAVSVDELTTSVKTRGRFAKSCLDDRNCSRTSLQRHQLGGNRLKLIRCQCPQCRYNPVQFGLSHAWLLGSSTLLRPNIQFPALAAHQVSLSIDFANRA